MTTKLNKIEIAILNKLHDYRFRRDKELRIDDIRFSLTSFGGIDESSEDVIIYLDSLNTMKYIRYNTDRRIDWEYIELTEKGRGFIEDYLYAEEEKIRNKLLSLIKEKSKDDVVINHEHGSYYEISINTNSKIIKDIKINKQDLSLIQSYKWRVNNSGNIYVANNYNGSKNKSIYRILFEKNIVKHYKNTDNKDRSCFSIFFKNNDKLDFRKENILLKASRTTIINYHYHKMTGIYKSSSNTDKHISYEVKINKNNIHNEKLSIYLIKTTNYDEAILAAFLLRLIFAGKEYTEAFMEKLDIRDDILEQLDSAISEYILKYNYNKLILILKQLNASELLIIKIQDVIEKHRDLIILESKS